jgi:hypothetical protein
VRAVRSQAGQPSRGLLHAWCLTLVEVALLARDSAGAVEGREAPARSTRSGDRGRVNRFGELVVVSHGSVVALVAVPGLGLTGFPWAPFIATPALVVFDLILAELSFGLARHG